jgi:hypothetical protein
VKEVELRRLRTVRVKLKAFTNATDEYCMCYDRIIDNESGIP